MQSIEDFAELLQFVYSQRIQTGKNKKTVHLKVNVLTYYAYILKQGEGYTDFEIAKKSGGTRKISTPKYVLKLIQKCLLELLSVIYRPHKAAHGFVLGKNVASNASIHVGKKFIYNIDIKNFFPSTPFHKIKFLFKIRPFNLNGEREKIAQLIASLCCKDGFLPQGAPTSPIITNIVCRRIDSKLSQLAFENKAKYSRYADDITFSCQENIFDADFLEKVKSILGEEKYEINNEKTRISNWRQRQEVTGVVVNEKKNLPREYIKDIRYWLFSWEKFGELSTQNDFEKRFPQKKGFMRYNGVTIQFKNYLYGKIQYLKMIRDKDDSMAIKFIEAYQKLENNDKKIQKRVRQPHIPTQTSSIEIDPHLHNHILNIRAALEIRGDFSIDYSFINEEHWKKQLMSDNLKMENCGIRNIGDDGRFVDSRDALYDFCRYACFQIELLLNIYFKKTYPNWSNLQSEISRLKADRKIAQNYRVYSYNSTINAVPLKTKWHIYAKTHSIMESSDLYKGIDAIREIRNLKTAHRPAELSESSFGNIPSDRLPQETYVEAILRKGQTEPIKNYLLTFVEQLKRTMPT